MFQRHAPLRIRPDGSLRQLRWMACMLAQCSSANYALNKQRMMRLAEYSRDVLRGLREEAGLSYEQRSLGTLQLFRSQAQLEVKYDGDPQFKDIEGTSLQYGVNTATPVIRVDDKNYYAVENAVWFVGAGPVGPWAVATSVPAEIYSIPPSSSLHYVTYVKVYRSTPEVVYIGYTPGYYGTVVSSTTTTVVYGTGFFYPPYVGSVWYGAPYTYGYGVASRGVQGRAGASRLVSAIRTAILITIHRGDRGVITERAAGARLGDMVTAAMPARMCTDDGAMPLMRVQELRGPILIRVTTVELPEELFRTHKAVLSVWLGAAQTPTSTRAIPPRGAGPWVTTRTRELSPEAAQDTRAISTAAKAQLDEAVLLTTQILVPVSPRWNNIYAGKNVTSIGTIGRVELVPEYRQWMEVDVRRQHATATAGTCSGAAANAEFQWFDGWQNARRPAVATPTRLSAAADTLSLRLENSADRLISKNGVGVCKASPVRAAFQSITRQPVPPRRRSNGYCVCLRIPCVSTAGTSDSSRSAKVDLRLRTLKSGFLHETSHVLCIAA
jgi:hypothetical protein